jgi:flagellin
MSFSINTNTSSLFSNNQLQKSQRGLTDSLERLSTGKRINKASDDASGMVIADRLASQARGFGQAIRNANDSISIAQIADGALGQATQVVQDIRVKVLQAGSGAQSTGSRQAIQAEINKSLEVLGSISQDTSYNGQKLLSGTFTDKQFQVGANSGETIEISLASIDPSKITHEEYGSLADIDVTTDEGVQAAIGMTDYALDSISQERAQLGSTHNQLESTINNLSEARINTFSSESSIRDLDFAEESSNLNKMNLLLKARVFALAQANEHSKNILNVLG